jgi:hypothetical protein
MIAVLPEGSAADVRSPRVSEDETSFGWWAIPDNSFGYYDLEGAPSKTWFLCGLVQTGRMGRIRTGEL